MGSSALSCKDRDEPWGSFTYCMKQKPWKVSAFPPSQFVYFICCYSRYFFLIVVKYAEHKFTVLIIFKSSVYWALSNCYTAIPTTHGRSSFSSCVPGGSGPIKPLSRPLPRPLATTTLLSVSMKLSLLEVTFLETHYWVKNPDKKEERGPPTQQVSLEFLVWPEGN